MKKSLTILSLSLIIVLSFGFVSIKLAANGSDTNYFNRALRPRLGAHPVPRQIFGLHNDGDARGEYLRPRYKKILIEIDAMEGIPAHVDALKLLTEKIQLITGKPASYIVSDKYIKGGAELNKQQIKDTEKRYRNYYTSGDTAVVYMLYLSHFENERELLGLTLQEDGIVIFEDALSDFTKDSQDTLALYEASTALHEFGHQLGLPHNSERGCLMNEHADQGMVASERPEDVIVDFCQYELKQIRG